MEAEGRGTGRGYMSAPAHQVWFFTPDWLTGEREADEEIKAGLGTVHGSGEDMFAYLNSLESRE